MLQKCRIQKSELRSYHLCYNMHNSLAKFADLDPEVLLDPNSSSDEEDSGFSSGEKDANAG